MSNIDDVFYWMTQKQKELKDNISGCHVCGLINNMTFTAFCQGIGGIRSLMCREGRRLLSMCEIERDEEKANEMESKK